MWRPSEKPTETAATVNDAADYGGPERRTTERVALSVALDEVRGLKGAVEKLATAVDSGPSKDDLVLSAQRLRQGLYWMAGMLTAFLALIVIILSWQHGRLDNDMSGEHNTIVCIQQIPIEQRTDTALLACKEGLR